MPHNRFSPLLLNTHCVGSVLLLMCAACDSSGGNDPVQGSSNNPTTPAVTAVTNPNRPDPVPLSPLPEPPLSPAPGPDDEPTPVNRPVTTTTRYFIVEDPARLIQPEPSAGLSEEDFAAGLPEPVFHIPADVDVTTNALPYFDGLKNQEVFAGETLEVLYRPLDDDGLLPGMFPNELPEGGIFRDNKNGTKTFIWTPLQGDIGITSFTVTALDKLAPNYKNEQTILIKVKEPADLSSIPNFPPVVNKVREHVVRVGSPVVLEIKGSDRNSTLPSIEILNPPPGASVTKHYIYDDVTVLRFIPSAPGPITINALARDADDPDLTAVGTITLRALPASSFTLPGKRLRALAGERNLLLGFAALQNYYYRPDGAVYSDLAGLEFNIVSAENSMKWAYINPLPGTFRWGATDNLISFAKHYNQIVHAHPLVWHRQLPIWIREAPAANLEIYMREYIDRIATRYRDDVAIWDVINEPIADEGGLRTSIWYNAMGEDYIDIAFRQARLSAPDGTLLLNEYDVAWDTVKTATLLPLLERLRARGTPLDGVGFQLHIDAGFNDFAEIEANFERVAALDLDIYITELDVAIKEAQTEAQQAAVFAGVLEVCLNQPRCKALQLWGFTDQYSWRRAETPLVLDTEYQAKPAYRALQRTLSQ